ncbi:SGNH/GDSL hydrolase family protein [Chthonobacter albigriseus]|uniref:SGNH/GDSL hydrolase family protein n=1 Tax=Chthonobacter albigriseus TaxID=1683161 RepID=UPI0015EF4252|nr:DUF459 domain-containing protein [Chthonobacter albigriseus]
MTDLKASPRRASTLGITAIVMFLAVFTAVSLALPHQAAAQLFENPPLLLRLFGVKKRETPPQQGGARIIQVPSGGKGQGYTGPSLGPNGPVMPRIIKAPEPALQIKPKNDDAKVVLVIGDAWGGSLAAGLNVAFADTPTVKIEAAAVEGSGLADRSKLDWPQKLTDRLAAKDAPNAVVVMLGPADRAPIQADGQEAEFRGATWETVYRARAQALIVAARSRNIPLFWVGLVPTADFDQTTDLAYLDELIRQENTDNLGVYVDVWNAFADATGSFAASGPDVEGQVRKLRLSDGSGFTKSGSRKLAFFVEQEIRKWLESGAPGIVLPTNSGSGLVVSLADPEADVDEGLAANGPPPVPKEGTALHAVIVEGKPIHPVNGRVDDLRVIR